MNRYEIYKETDFEWIGEIPFDWELSRVGKFFNQRLEKADDITYPPLSVTMSGIVDQLSNVAKTNDGDNRKLVKKDDFVINSRSDRKGSSGISPRDGSVSLINIVLEPHGLDPQFIQHLFKSYFFKEEYFRNGKGIHWDLWTTRWDQFKNINIPIPSTSEQKLISRYLDKKTVQIDRLIDKIQKKIELLKEQRTSLINQCVSKGLDPNVEMKDSGVEWIGNIPSHWKLGRFKYYISVLTDFTANGSFKSLADNVEYLSEGYSRLVRLTDLRRDLQNDGVFVSIESHNFLKKSELFGNEILIANVGAYTGFALKMKSKQGVCTLGPNMFLVRNNNEMSNVDYIVYLINSYAIKTALDLVISSTAQPKINKDNLKSLVVPIPPKKEQEEIAVALNETLKTIDNVIDKKNKRVLLLQEYKQSLISSAVTGKVRITENMI